MPEVEKTKFFIVYWQTRKNSLSFFTIVARREGEMRNLYLAKELHFPSNIKNLMHIFFSVNLVKLLLRHLSVRN